MICSHGTVVREVETSEVVMNFHSGHQMRHTYIPRMLFQTLSSWFVKTPQVLMWQKWRSISITNQGSFRKSHDAWHTTVPYRHPSIITDTERISRAQQSGQLEGGAVTLYIELYCISVHDLPQAQPGESTEGSFKFLESFQYGVYPLHRTVLSFI